MSFSVEVNLFFIEQNQYINVGVVRGIATSL